MDLVFGRFADDHIGEMAESEVDALESLLEFADTDLHNWITGKEAVPAAVAGPLFERIRDYSSSLSGS